MEKNPQEEQLESFASSLLAEWNTDYANDLVELADLTAVPAMLVRPEESELDMEQLQSDTFDVLCCLSETPGEPRERVAVAAAVLEPLVTPEGQAAVENELEMFQEMADADLPSVAEHLAVLAQGKVQPGQVTVIFRLDESVVELPTDDAGLIGAILREEVTSSMPLTEAVDLINYVQPRFIRLGLLYAAAARAVLDWAKEN